MTSWNVGFDGLNDCPADLDAGSADFDGARAALFKLMRYLSYGLLTAFVPPPERPAFRPLRSAKSHALPSPLSCHDMAMCWRTPLPSATTCARHCGCSHPPAHHHITGCVLMLHSPAPRPKHPNPFRPGPDALRKVSSTSADRRLPTTCWNALAAPARRVAFAAFMG